MSVNNKNFRKRLIEILNTDENRLLLRLHYVAERPDLIRFYAPSLIRLFEEFQVFGA